MTALYALVEQYREDAAKLNDLDLDEQTVLDTLEGMTGDIELKAKNVAMMYLSLDFMAQAHADRAAVIAERGAAISRRAASLREYLSRCLEAAGIQKLESTDVRISWRKSSAVQITGEDLIPFEFMRAKPAPPPAPDKAAIKAAIADGVDVPGAHIEHRKTLVIA